MSPLQFDPKTGRVIMPKPVLPYNEDNIVFKCNWNDKGWKGTCSRRARDFNVSKNHPWCVDKLNTCEGGIGKKKEGYPCNESYLFVNFQVNPGSYLKGKKRTEEKHIRGASKGKLAFLTTIGPGDKEKDRYFIGIFDIEKIEDEREVYGNKETSIIITPKIKVKFWKYYKNKDGSIMWGPRQRYFDDKNALKILLDLNKKYNKVSGFAKEKKNLDMLIERYKKWAKE